MRPCTVHAPSCILVAVLVVGECMLAASQRGAHRSLQSRQTNLSEDDLRALGVPEGANFLFQLTSDCPPQPPPEVVARMGVLCNLINNTRGCRNLTLDEPQFRFHGCTKQAGCPPAIDAESDATCILKGFGIERSVDDECENCRCGVRPADQHLFEEDQLTISRPVANAPGSVCFSAHPKGGKLTTQLTCNNGQLGAIVRWLFKFPRRANKEPYDCIFSRRCKDGIVDEIAACYQNGTSDTARATPVLTSGVRNQSLLSHHVCAFLTLTLIAMMLGPWGGL